MPYVLYTGCKHSPFIISALLTMSEVDVADGMKKGPDGSSRSAPLTSSDSIVKREGNCPECQLRNEIDTSSMRGDMSSRGDMGIFEDYSGPDAHPITRRTQHWDDTWSTYDDVELDFDDTEHTLSQREEDDYPAAPRAGATFGDILRGKPIFPRPTVRHRINTNDRLTILVNGVGAGTCTEDEVDSVLSRHAHRIYAPHHNSHVITFVSYRGHLDEVREEMPYVWMGAHWKKLPPTVFDEDMDWYEEMYFDVHNLHHELRYYPTRDKPLRVRTGADIRIYKGWVRYERTGTDARRFASRTSHRAQRRFDRALIQSEMF